MSEASQFGQWQTIDNAPKDGTPILALCSNDRQTVVRWENVPFVQEGWFVTVPCLGGIGVGSDTAIHWDEDKPIYWMPLPKP